MQRRLTTKHLMTNAPTIIHEFGMFAFMRCCARCLFKPKATFAELVMQLHQA
jgi:hypothetical protein